MRVLFICGRNQLRSPTAEAIFSGRPGIEVDSAGLDPACGNPLTSETVQWADLILVMEKQHRRRLQSQYGRWLKGKRIVCLDIPDRYRFMDPALVELLEQRAGPLLP